MSYRIKGRRRAEPKCAGKTMEHYIPWIHIVFFSTWIGANLFCLAIFLPASRSLAAGALWQARSRASRGLNAVTVVSAPLVLISGCASFLSSGLVPGTAFEWGYASVGAAKLVLTLVMTLNHWRQAFRYAPTTTGPRGDSTQASDPREAMWKVWVRLLTTNVVLGFAVFCLGLYR